MQGSPLCMEAEQIIESLANYIGFLRVTQVVCISHLLLINRRTPVDLWHHKFAVLVTFTPARTFLGLTSETMICNNLTGKMFS